MNSTLVEVCSHGIPLGWACVGCRVPEKKAGTSPAHRADPPRFVRAEFLRCGHEPLADLLRIAYSAIDLDYRNLTGEQHAAIREYLGIR